MKTRTSLALAFVVAAAAGACAPKKDTANPEPKACTEEAMVCPDGSSVSREGPNCEFAACPASETPDEAAAPEGEGEPAEGEPAEGDAE